MANNISSDLVSTVLAGVSLNKVTPILTPITLVSTDFSEYAVTPKTSTIKIPLATVGSTATTSNLGSKLSDYETSSTELSSVGVDLDLINVSFGLSPEDIENGRSLEQLVQVNLQTLALAIQTKFNALFTEANFGTAEFSGTAANFTKAKINEIWGKIEHPFVNGIVDKTLFANFIPSDKNSFDYGVMPGFNSFVPSTTTGMGTNIKGAILAPTGIAVASRLPYVPDNVGVETQVIDLGAGMPPILARKWFSLSKQSEWMSFSVMFGCAKADTAKVKLVKITG